MGTGGNQRRRRIRTRLYGFAAVAALFTALVGGVGLSGYANLRAANAAENRLGSVQALTLDALAQQHTIRAQAWFAVATAAGGTGRSMSEVRHEFDAARTRLSEVNEKLAAIVAGTPYAERFWSIRAAEDTVVALADSAITLTVRDRPAALARIDQLEDTADALDREVTELSDALAADRDRRLAAAGEMTRLDSLRLLGAAVLALVLAAGISAWLGRLILGPLRALADVAQRIGAGDLTARCALARVDEIDAVAKALNTTADQLSSTMSHLAAEAGRERLSSHLTEAFDMAETESEAYTVVTRTLQVLAPLRPAELLLADNSRARLARQAACGPGDPPGCPVGSPHSCVAVRRGHTTVFDDSDGLNACPKLKGRPGGRISAVCMPVTFMGRSLGVIHTVGPAGERPDEPVLATLSMLASQTGSRIGTLRSFAQAQLQASTDGLTGLRNRRAFESDARELLLGGERAAVVMADLDKFKVLNDTHGHEAGDRALRVFGQALRVALREHDIAGRIGGEEFGIVLHDVSADEAVAIVDRLRATLRQGSDGASVPAFTASFGISCTDGHTTFDELLRKADKALYRSKHNGRDRITVGEQNPADAVV